MSNNIRILTLTFIVSLPHLMVKGQVFQRSELAFGLGIFTYVGDLSKTYNFVNARPAATLLYRLNVSKSISLRVALVGGMLAASDKDITIDALARTRSASFGVFLFESHVGFEYHFLNWHDAAHRTRFTPYLFAAAGLFSISGMASKPTDYSNVQLAIPFGGGVKYILNPKWYIAFEVGYRKIFFDYLDNVSGGDPSIKNYRYGNAYDDDGYFFVGLSLSRTFYTILCAHSPYK